MYFWIKLFLKENDVQQQFSAEWDTLKFGFTKFNLFMYSNDH